MVEDSDRIVGTVKWFDAVKGYGFVGQDGGDDIFVHFSSIQMDGYWRLNKDQVVEFSIEEGPKGLQAACVQAYEESEEEKIYSKMLLAVTIIWYIKSVVKFIVMFKSWWA